MTILFANLIAIKQLKQTNKTIKQQLIMNIYHFQVFVNVLAIDTFQSSFAYEIYLFQKFKKIGYPFETYGLIGHLENRVKVIWQKELFSINFS